MGRVKRNQQGWYRASCLTAERLCRATLEWARQRQTQNFSGESAGLEGYLTGSMTFRRKSQLICRGRKNGGTRKRDNKHDDLTLRSQANAPDWLHSIESQREKEPIEESMMISTPPRPPDHSTWSRREWNWRDKWEIHSTKLLFDLDLETFPK